MRKQRDGTLRIWKGKSGLEIETFVPGSAILSTAICVDNRKVATSLENGELKVLDCPAGKTIYKNADAHGIFLGSDWESKEGSQSHITLY